MATLGIIVFRREQGAWNDSGLQTKRSHGAILQSRFTTILRSEGSPHNRGMKNKFHLPLVAVFTYSFQNYGSLHLIQAAASKKHAQIRTVDFSTAFCGHGSWSFTPNLRPVQKIKTKFLVSPYFTVRNYCLTDFHFYLFWVSHLLFGMSFSLMKRFFFFWFFFKSSWMLYCLSNAHFMPVPVTNC